MTWQAVGAGVLLALGVGIELLCCLGILMMDDVFDRLYYLGPATALGSIAIAAVVVLQEALLTAGIKAIMVAAALLGAGPVACVSTGPAARTRRLGAWRIQPAEEVGSL
jgi:multisubunit Na+/H+ antiporter MnhG subunit